MFGCNISAIFCVGSEQTVPPRPEIKPKKLLTGLMLAGSASALSLSLAASEAHAQALPAGCTSDGTIPGTAQAGDTVTCVAAAPAEIDPISTNVDDLTIVVGDATTPTTVNGGTMDAIRASNNVGDTGDLRVNSVNGAITARATGIWVYNRGLGNVDIETGDIDGLRGNGVSVFTLLDGAAPVTIDTTAGSVFAQTAGVFVDNDGNSDLTITTGDLNGSTYGVLIKNYGDGSVNLDSSAGDISTRYTGIRIRNILKSGETQRQFGKAYLSLGDVTTTIRGRPVSASHAVYISNASNLTDIELTAGAEIRALGSGAGISVKSYTAEGDIAVSGTSGNLLSGGRAGAMLVAESGDITIGGIDTIIGAGGFGIEAETSGSGEISITAADVSGAFVGITVSAEDGDISIDTSEGVVFGANGIGARSYGSGSIQIKANDITGAYGNGIFAISPTSTGGVDVETTGIVSGANNGIVVAALGNIAIRANVSNGGSGIGIFAAKAGSGDLVISANAVSGGTDGINAQNAVSGKAEVSVGNAYGILGDGIYVANSAGTTDLIIATTGSVSGGDDGIEVINNGAGGTSISVNNATATSGDGINATSGINTTDLTIVATGTVSGGDDGISALSSGSGDISVTAVDVTGTSGRGIYASNYDPAIFFNYGPLGAAVSVTATGDVVGGTTGIVAVGGGYGDVTVNAHNVTGTAQNGIFAGGGFLYGNVIINTTGLVSGGGYNNSGIWVSHAGSGDVTINSVDVTGGRSGIRAEASFGNVDVVSTGTVNSRVEGISGYTSYGSLSIEANNIYSSGTGANASFANAIHAENRTFGSSHSFSTATDITVNGTISGGNRGIFVDHIASDPVTITLGSSASVTGRSGEGISATTQDASITVQGNSGTITGATDGVYLRTAGADITVDSIDSITGLNGDGIDAASSGGAITVSDVDTITGQAAFDSNGIRVVSGGGDISVQGSGLVGGITGVYGHGIFADARGGGSINIGGTSANGDIYGGSYGVFAITDGAGNIAVNVQGDVEGVIGGISANAMGAGFVDIDTAGIYSGAGNAIVARSSGGNINVDATGTLYAAGYGILTENNGTGSTAINVADVTSQAADGIHATNGSGSTDLEISATGSVTGYTGGIIASNYSSGDLTISVADVTVAGPAATTFFAPTGESVGVFARNNTTGALSITSTGLVAGGSFGIQARQYGTGLLSINSHDVTSTGSAVGQAAVFADSRIAAGGQGVSIDVTGDIVGGNRGIRANANSGDLSLTANNVTGMAGSAIFTTNGGGDTSITIYGDIRGNVTGTPMSGGQGITAVNHAADPTFGLSGAGSLTIDARGNVEGFLSGIVALNEGSGPTSVSVAGSLTGQTYGLIFRNAGLAAGQITVADVSGSTGHGIYATNGLRASERGGLLANVYGPLSGGTDLSITASGTVSGGMGGVDVYNYGTGHTTINVVDVSGGTGDGIKVENKSTATDLTIVATSTVKGGDDGIEAVNNGTGTTTITLGSIASVTGQGSEGIYARSVGALTVQGNSGTITGATDGVYLRTAAADITVDTIDSITGLNGDGIDANSGGGNITIQGVGSITGQDTTLIPGESNGVFAVSGAGDLTVRDVGSVVADGGTGSDGLDLSSNTGNITVANVGSVSATGGNGIVVGSGSGNISIYGNGDISGTTNGISARTDYYSSISIDTTLGSVSATTYGIAASAGSAGGGGHVSIVTGDVSSVSGRAIIGSTLNGSGSVLIDTTGGTINGNIVGRALSSDADVNIVTADVTVVGHNAITAVADQGALSIDTTAGKLTASFNGIEAQASGAGDISIVSGDIESFVTGIQIQAQPTFTGDVSVDSTAGTIDAFGNGIFVANAWGSNQTNTIVTGDVLSTQASGVWIFANNNATTLIDTTGGTISSSQYGILGASGDGGTMTIVAADVTSVYGDAIATGSGADAFSVDTTAGSISGGYNGIRVFSRSAGDIDITTGDVEGRRRAGIYIYGRPTSNSSTATIAIDSTAGTVEGIGEGIVVNTDAAAEISLSVADVAGEFGDGIRVENGIGSTDLTIVATGTISGGEDGIEVTNRGTGNTSVTTADVNATTGAGIRLSGGSGDAVVDTKAGTITAAQDGIYGGTGGSLTLTTGDINAGATSYGINIRNSGAVSIDTTAGSIEAGRGISVRNQTGVLNITTGDITATDGFGTTPPNFGSARAIDIRRSQFERGEINVDTTGGVITSSGNGVRLSQFGFDNATITTGVINSYRAGVFAINGGLYGDLTINATGNITSDASTGILVIAGYQGNPPYEGELAGNVIVTSTGSSISGEYHGIAVEHNGYGDVAIAASDATGNVGDGIQGKILSAANLLITTDGTVTGGQHGIYTSVGSGATYIGLGSDADIVGLGDEGIHAQSNGGAITIFGASGTITGATDGVYIRTVGADITADDIDSITGLNGDGIDAASAGGKITITDVDTILGTGGYGILAVSGGGDISIQGSGLVGGITGTGGSGIFADGRGGAGGEISIGAEAALGDVVGQGSGSRGILVRTDGAGSIAIDTTSGSVTGDLLGIDAASEGSGAVSIITGDVTGSTHTALFASNQGTSITIDTTKGIVSGSLFGVDARNYGSGLTSITTADVNAQFRSGVFALNRGTDLTIDTTAGEVVAADRGVEARQYGSGALSITTAAVNGDQVAISARNYGSSVSIISTGPVVGQTGITSFNFGPGDQFIATADVTAASGYGIRAFNVASAGAIEVDTTGGSVAAGGTGISISNQTGKLTKLTTADVEADGFKAIQVNASGETLVDTTAGSVTGAQDGIGVYNFGMGNVDVITADVTAQNGKALTVSASSGDISVNTSAGKVVGQVTGVRVIQSGLGGTSITTADVSSNAFFATVWATTQGAGLTIDTTAGTIAGNGRGILAEHSGTGSVSITTADVTATVGDGILAINSANGTDLTIDSSAGSVSGPYDGVEAFNYGSGALSITTADVSSTIDDGIFARNDGTSLTIDSSAGTVTGGTEGIFARQYGTDTLAITVGDVTGLGGAAIDAASTDANADLTVQSNMGDAVGATDGMYLRTAGADIAVDNFGTVEGQAGDGIDAASSGGTIAITNIKTVLGTGGSGLNADSDGGAITIDNVGSMGGVTATGGFGILADASSTSGAGGEIGIIAAGNVSGSIGGISAITNEAAITIDSSAGAVSGESAVLATTSGLGSIDITIGDATSTSGDGIYAVADGGGITIDSSAGSVSGYATGIFAQDVNGTVSVTSADVTGTTNGSGIIAQGNGGVTVDSSAGTVTGAFTGVFAQELGSGAVVVSTGDVVATRFDGIFASNNDGSIAIDGNAGSIIAGTIGINASSDSGMISITAIGSATGAGGDGIRAISDSGDISIQNSGLAGGIIGGTGNGITSQSGSGDIGIGDVAAIGDVDGDVFGISASTEGNGSIAIDSSGGTVTGGAEGIRAFTAFGSGSIDITTADVSGAINGIVANTGVASTDGLSIDTTAGSITGGSYGIYAANGGTGSIEIATDDVTSTSQSAIRANNYGMGAGPVAIDTTAGTVVGGSNAISVVNAGTGTIDIAVADVIGATSGIFSNANTGSTTIMLATMATVTGQGASAINARASGGAIAVDGNWGAVIGATDGLYLRTAGGDASVANFGSITGMAGDGADIATDGGAISIADNKTILGTGGNGILASSNGGDISIQSNGLVGGVTGTAGAGISADASGGAGGNVDIGGIATNGAISGSTYGILANTDGVGSVTVNSTGGAVSGDQAGIGAIVLGSGDLAIVSADVSSANGTAIDAVTTGGDLAIDSSGGGVSGATNGIRAINDGIGVLSVLSGNVTGTSGDGIAAAITNAANTSELTIESSAGSVTGGTAGIEAIQEGSGALGITSGDVTSTAGDAIIAVANGGGITIDTTLGSVAGDQSGIEVAELGGGAVSISTADVTGTNAAGIAATSLGGVVIDSSQGTLEGATYGIMAVNSGADDVVITTASVTGGTTGIGVNAGSGALTLNIGGDVSGGDTGIMTVTENGTNLTVAEGQTISGGSIGIATMANGGSAKSNDVLNILGSVDGAIMTFEGDDVVTLAEGGTIDGAVMLGDGADTLNFDGATVGALRGGEGEDTLNFNAGAGLFTDSGDASNDGIAEFEIYNFNIGGFALAGEHTGLTEVNFNVGDSILMDTLSALQTNIAMGATLQTANGTIINGNLSNAGLLGLNAGGFGTLTINGNFAQTADGALNLDVFDSTNFDQLVVSGNVDLAGTLNLNQPLPIGDTVTLIAGGTGLSGIFDTVNGLFEGLLINQSIAYDVSAFDVNLVAEIVDASSISGVTPNQGGIANALIGEFVAGNLTGDIEDLAIGLAMITDADDLSAILDELSPEIAGAGIDGIRLSQDYFLQSLLSQAWATGGNSGNSLAYSGRTGAPISGAMGLASDGAQVSDDGPTIWGAVNYNDHRNDSTINNIGYDADGVDITAGISNIPLGSWEVGFAAGFTDFDSRGLRGLSDIAATNLLRLGVHAGNEFGSSGFGGRIDVAAAYGTGETDLTMITGLGAAQTGTADIKTYGAGLRLTLDGGEEKKWPLRPFVSVSYDSLSQNATVLQGGGATDLALDAIDLDRFTVGYGVNFVQDWNRTSLRLGATGYHYTGDTQVQIASRFAAIPGNAGAFTTVGFDIENQWQFDAGIDQRLGNGWSISADAYLGTGDIESFGGMLKIGKKF